MTTAIAASQPQEMSRPTRKPVRDAALFVGITLALAALAAVAVIASGPAEDAPGLRPGPAAGPGRHGAGLARRGNGAVGRLYRQLTVRPANPAWYLVLLIPVIAFLAVDVVAVALGEPSAGMFDSVFPAVLIVPLVVILPAFAEEIAWRGYALPRTLTAMSPLARKSSSESMGAHPRALVLAGPDERGECGLVECTQVIAYWVILTWIYVGTGGSVLIPGLSSTPW